MCRARERRLLRKSSVRQHAARGVSGARCRSRWLGRFRFLRFRICRSPASRFSFWPFCFWIRTPPRATRRARDGRAEGFPVTICVSRESANPRTHDKRHLDPRPAPGFLHTYRCARTNISQTQTALHSCTRDERNGLRCTRSSALRLVNVHARPSSTQRSFGSQTSNVARLVRSMYTWR
jgi:hypothetical protein